MKLFDSHCHLYMQQFDADREAVIDRMREAHMGATLIGVDLATSRQALELANQHDFLWAAVGLHPNDNATEEFDPEAYEQLAGDPKVVAIGECGLDFFRNEPSAKEVSRQLERFQDHIKLALVLKKALIVHCRPTQDSLNAHNEVIKILQFFKKKHTDFPPVVIHFFTASAEVAQKYLDLGCYLSFPGPITYTDTYDEAIKVAPLGRILIETDAPFAAPVPHRGKRNEPMYVAEVAKKVALIKGISASEVEAATVANAQTVFGLA